MILLLFTKKAAWRKLTALNTNVSLHAVSIRVDPTDGLHFKVPALLQEQEISGTHYGAW